MSRTAWMLSGLLLACMATARAAIPEWPSFRTITVAAGLPSSHVNAIAQDRAGYLWIATADGLARYDGVGFRIWRHDPAEPGSLPGNNVQALHVDAFDRVWVATESGGLSVLDPERRHFRHFRMATHPAIGSDDTWAIASRGGVLWFGTWGGGLHRLGRDGRITRFMPADGDPHSLPGASVLALAFDDAGRLWVGTTRGLARWTGAGFERVRVPGAGDRPVVYAIVRGQGGLWIGTDHGLHWRQARGRWRDPAWTRRFSRPNAALALATGRDGGLWIGSQQGLWRVRAGDRPQRVEASRPEPGTAAVGALLLDRDGALWVAQPGIGLGYLRADWRRFAQFPRAGRVLAPTHYRAVSPAREGGFWLAGGGEPPVRLDGEGRVHALPRRVLRRIPGLRARALAEDRDGVLWAGGRDRLVRIGADGSVRAWRLGEGADAIRGGVDLLRIAGDGSVWLSCAGTAVQRRAADDGHVLQEWRAGTRGLGGADIEAMAFAGDGALWIAGAGGVSRLPAGADDFEPLPALGRGRVYAMAFDGPASVWLSRPTGLEHHRWNGRAWRLAERLDARQGIPAVEASGLVVDARHRPWLSTARGLFRWDPGSRRTRRFGVQDGLASQEFAPRGLALAGDGALAATTNLGSVVLFDTLAPRKAAVARALQVSEVAIRDDGHWRPLHAGVARLPADVRELRVRARLLAYGDPGAIRYESWLEGDDRGWLAQDSGERIIAGLHPGHYVLHLRATDADGNRSPPRVLRWLVVPPWWRTPGALGAWALMALALLALPVMALRGRLRARRRMQRLEQRRELAEQASRAKSRFLADLGHEVRTPMTGVLGMSELLLDGPLDPAQRRRVDAIRSAGQHLLQLVDEALDLARIEAGRLRLDPQPFSLRAMLADIAALQAPLAHRRGLRFALGVEPGLPAVFRGDVLRIKQVLFNLLGNAIKFTERGEVGLQVESLPDGGIRFTVLDTGPGLEAAQHARLFRRFEQGDGAGTAALHGGSGLGLAITQELVSAMGGGIRVHGAAGAGTRFAVELPLEPCQPRAEQACTASTSAVTCVGSMSGDMPWPRLNTCPSREPPLPAA